MIKGAIFDADGTLLDSMHIWNEVGERYLYSLGKLPEKDLRSVLFPMTLEESSIYLKEHYQLTQSPEKIKADVLGIIDDFYRFEVELKRGVRDYLNHLFQHGIPMTVATTSDQSQIDAALSRLGIRGFFQGIYTCSEYQTNKREPLIYLKTAEAMGVDPTEVAVFEDVLYAVKTANKAGFYTVAVEDAASSDKREEIKKTADLYIQDFSDPALKEI